VRPPHRYRAFFSWPRVPDEHQLPNPS
jgi:hypothetical protein